jgi:diphthamide biosynthesis methyltransferase
VKKTNKVAEIETKLATIEEVKKAFKVFMEQYTKEGCDLRLESRTSICGKRIVVVFDYYDMG